MSVTKEEPKGHPFEDNGKNLSLILTVCKKNITETGEAEQIEKLLDRHRSYETVLISLQQTFADGLYSPSFADFLGLTAEMIVLTDDLVAINEEAMENAEKQPRILADQAQRNAAVLFGVIITAILILSYGLSYRVAIDSFRFPWVITNLVGNALRYTGPEGKISLKVYEKGFRYYFQCSGTGDGIDPKVLPHIFDRFTPPAGKAGGYLQARVFKIWMR